MKELLSVGLTLTLLALAAGLYFLPSIIAATSKPKHRQVDAIVALNLLLGWTLLGWVAALVWSLTKGPEPVAPPPPQAAAPMPSPRQPSDDEIPVYEIPETQRRPRR